MDQMKSLFIQYLAQFVIVYLDYILIYSEKESEYVEHVQKVLEALRENMLYANKSKCTLGVYRTDYLGFILKDDGVEHNSNKTTIES